MIVALDNISASSESAIGVAQGGGTGRASSGSRVGGGVCWLGLDLGVRGEEDKMCGEFGTTSGGEKAIICIWKGLEVGVGGRRRWEGTEEGLDLCATRSATFSRFDVI